MSNLANVMANICATNNFTTISIDYRVEPAGPEHTFGAWAHWSDRQCISAYGSTPQAALANVIMAAAAKRALFNGDLDWELAA